MKRMTKADIVFITIAILFAMWGAYFVYTKGYGPLNSLKKNKIYTTAVVTGETYILKGLGFYIYRYEVEDKEYEIKNMKVTLVFIAIWLCRQEALYR